MAKGDPGLALRRSARPSRHTSPKQAARGIVTLASFTCQWRDALMGRTQRNQWLAEFESGAGHLENPLFLADVTMPAGLAREHDLPLWRAWGVFLEGVAKAQSGEPGGGLADMRRGAELLREQNFLLLDGLSKIALAQAEARAGDVDRALAILGEALATCERTGHRMFEAELHRARRHATQARSR